MTPKQFCDVLDALGINQRQWSDLTRLGLRTVERHAAIGPTPLAERVLELLLEGKITIDDLARPALRGDMLKAAMASRSAPASPSPTGDAPQEA